MGNALARFALYVDHIRSLPGVRFVTASELPGIYADALRRDGATAEEMSELVQRIASGLDVQVIQGKAFSVADQFELFTEGEWAWPSSAADDTKIIAELKRGANAVLSARSGRGTQTKDSFSLSGYTAAVDEASKRCK